jgi:hypothetical protein
MPDIATSSTAAYLAPSSKRRQDAFIREGVFIEPLRRASSVGIAGPGPFISLVVLDAFSPVSGPRSIAL